jgi:lipid-A-disaccharide synthase
MFVIFPFEEDFYKHYGVNALFVGHPLAKKIKEFIENKKSFLKNSFITIGVLPGSREKEVKNHLPVMVNSLKRIKNVNILVGVAKLIDVEFVKY